MSARNGSAATDLAAWVRARDGEYADAVAELSAERLFAGEATLLWPSARDRRELVKLAGSDPEAAASRLAAHVLPLRVAALRDFARAETGTCGGVALGRATVADGLARFPGFALRALADGRDGTAGRGRAAPAYAVYEITEGAPPETGAFWSPARTTGGAEVAAAADAAGAEGAEWRAPHADAVERAFVTAWGRDGRDAAFAVYADAAAAALGALKARDPDAFAAAAPQLDWNPLTTFYLLLEPYRYQDHTFDIGREAATSRPLADYRALLGEARAAAAEKTLSAAAYAAQVDETRAHILRQAGASMCRLVEAAYKDREARNVVAGRGPALPAPRPGAGVARAAWADEFRLEAAALCSDLAKTGDINVFTGDIIDLVRNRYPGANYSGELVLLNSSRASSDCAPRAYRLALFKFVNSTAFLHSLPPAEAAGKFAGSPSPLDERIYNANAVGALLCGARRRAVVGGGEDPEQGAARAGRRPAWAPPGARGAAAHVDALAALVEAREASLDDVVAALRAAVGGAGRA